MLKYLFERVGIFTALLLLSACASQQSTPLNTTTHTTTTDPLKVSEHSVKPKISAAQRDTDTVEEEQAEQTPEGLWQTAVAEFSLEFDTDHPDVKKYIKWYSSRPKLLEKMFNQAEPFAYHIVQELAANDLPMELLLLPAVESAYDPFAYSHSRAAGLWQFMPATGQTYGIQRDQWYDGRRNVVDSTDAALTYLSYLNEMFDGDWLLALAAYNSGEGRVSRSIRKAEKNGIEGNFWNISLPRETRGYVPKLIALCEIVANPDKYGIALPEVEAEPYFETVSVPSQIDLSLVANQLRVPLTELQQLNGGYRRVITPPEGPHDINVPADRAPLLMHMLDSTSPDSWVPVSEYIVKRGDNLSTIARQLGVTSNWLMANNQLNSTVLQIGQVLRVPKPSALGSPEYDTAPPMVAQTVAHKVQPGESLWSIAKRYKTSVATIKAANKLSNDAIRVNQTLQITSQNAYVPVANNLKKVSYKVQRGDSLWKIASQYQVAVKDITRWNKLASSKYLRPGQFLTLYVDPIKI